MSSLPYTKIIDIADFSDPSLLPHLEDIASSEMQRFGLTKPEIVPDSKQWECAMMLRTLSDHGVLRPGALIAGVGAGTEETTFVLASKGCVVLPTDRYLEQTPWSDVAPAGMMVRPQQYSLREFPRGAIIPVHSDARVLSLPSGFVDAVYSAGSIEHFGSLEAVEAAAEEIGRVLKPGGIAVISTEFRLDGPNDHRWFSDDCILFTPELLKKHIVIPSGLELIDERGFDTSKATYDSRVVLLDFLEKAKCVETLTDKRNAYPNLVLFHEGYLFCSVHLALRKPLTPVSSSGERAAKFTAIVAADATRTSGILAAQIAEWTRSYDRPSPAVDIDALVSHVSTLESHASALESHTSQLELELQRLRQSRSFRITRPLRGVTRMARSTPVVRDIGRYAMRALRAIRRLAS